MIHTRINTHVSKQKSLLFQAEAKHLEADTPDIVSPEEAPVGDLVDEGDLLSPEEPPGVAVEGVYDLDGSSSEGVTPDMDPQVLFIKLKEVTHNNID